MNEEHFENLYQALTGYVHPDTLSEESYKTSIQYLLKEVSIIEKYAPIFHPRLFYQIEANNYYCGMSGDEYKETIVLYKNYVKERGNSALISEIFLLQVLFWNYIKHWSTVE